MQLSYMLAQAAAPQYLPQIEQDMAMTMGGQPQMGGGAAPQMMQSDNIAGIPQKEHGVVKNAREKAQNASQPGGGAK